MAKGIITEVWRQIFVLISCSCRKKRYACPIQKQSRAYIVIKQQKRPEWKTTKAEYYFGRKGTLPTVVRYKGNISETVKVLNWLPNFTNVERIRCFGQNCIIARTLVFITLFASGFCPNSEPRTVLARKASKYHQHSRGVSGKTTPSIEPLQPR